MTRQSPKITYALIAGGLALLVVLPAAWILRDLLNPYWVWLGALSVITFLFYGYDKSQAQRGGGRVPEVVLHGLALAGGFIGGWLGRPVFHHKTQKPVFTVVLAAATVIHAVLIYLIFLR